MKRLPIPKSGRFFRWLYLVPMTLLPVFCSGMAWGQALLKGVVTSKATGSPLPYVEVRMADRDAGTMSGTDGHFRLKTPTDTGTLIFSRLGYETRSVSFRGSGSLQVSLSRQQTNLNEVVVESTNERYRNKGNPAVALIRQVIAHKEENQLGHYDYVQYKAYEKLQMGLLTDTGAVFEAAGPLLRPFRFVFQNRDTTRFPGKALLPLYLEENIKRYYHRRSPEARQIIWEANKKVHFDERYVNNNGATTVMRFFYQDVSVYQNNIRMLDQSFLTPTSPLAPTFYQFYIVDTVRVAGGDKAVQLVFMPRNKTDLLFNGKLLISLDGHYSVVGARLAVGNTANLNWVTGLNILLDYQPGDDGRYHLSRSLVQVRFGDDPQAQRELFAEKMTMRSAYNTRSVIPDSVFALPSVASVPDSGRHKAAGYWKSKRPVPLTHVEAMTYAHNDRLNGMKTFNRILDWGSLLFTGYKRWGPLEIGPTGTFFSFNPVEGYKQRIGGRTTEAFSRRFYGAGYLGYGFKDRRLKYYLSWAYSFNKKSIYDYPVHYLRASVQRDLGIPGQGFQYASEGNILLSFKRGVTYRYLYQNVYQLEYVYEFGPHIRLETRLKRRTQEPAGDFRFTTAADGLVDTVAGITTSDLGFVLRWAPNEHFFDQKDGRVRVPSRYPVITGGVQFGIKGLAGGEYAYQKINLSVDKRFYLSQLGYADVTVAGGYLSGDVPYPVLFIPQANETYSFQYRSFNLMNFLEFVSDRYVSLHVDYHMEGFILNKIPGLKWLRFREVAGFSLLCGSLREGNDPVAGSGLFQFPLTANGIPTTYALGAKPYMEFNVGIENILRVFRIDYVRRLSYLQHPDIDPWGFRLSVHLSF